jgi:hypothetical protein
MSILPKFAKLPENMLGRDNRDYVVEPKKNLVELLNCKKLII